MSTNKSFIDDVDERTKLVGSSKLELLLFKLNNKSLFGINVFKVKEVLKCPKIHSVPKSHESVKGLITVREHTLPVIDLNIATGDEPIKNFDECFVIITEYNGSTQAFLVNAVDKIINVNWSDVQKPPKGLNSHYLTAITKLNSEIVQVLDVEKVISNVQKQKTHIDNEVIEASKFINTNKYIMVVDDSSVARNQVVNCLKSLSLKYKTFENGKEALEHIKEVSKQNNPKDEILLVLSDIEMPEMDGYTLTSKIKMDQNMRDLHVILHTSISGTFNEQLTLKAGADKLLHKFDSDILAKFLLETINDFKLV